MSTPAQRARIARASQSRRQRDESQRGPGTREAFESLETTILPQIDTGGQPGRTTTMTEPDDRVVPIERLIDGSAARAFTATPESTGPHTPAPGIPGSRIPGTLTSAEPVRPTLAVIQGQPKRKVPFVLFCLMALLVAFVTVLALNISISSSQYELVALRNQQTELLKNNDRLTQEQQLLQSPQNLAAKAQELGMVSPKTTGQVNVDAGTVSGNPTPAEKTEDPAQLIAAADIQGQINPNEGKGLPPNSTEQNTPSQGDPNLLGGTIPAPQQKVAE